MRAWAVKDADGAIWLSSLERRRRAVERALCQEYVGAESTWPRGYLQRFEEDLAERLKSERLTIIEVEVSEIPIRDTPRDAG